MQFLRTIKSLYLLVILKIIIPFILKKKKQIFKLNKLSSNYCDLLRATNQNKLAEN